MNQHFKLKIKIKAIRETVLTFSCVLVLLVLAVLGDGSCLVTTWAGVLGLQGVVPGYQLEYE